MAGIQISKAQAQLVSWGIATIMAIFALALSVAWVRGLYKLTQGQDGLFSQHFTALVGLPAAGTCSFMIVIALRHLEGPIEIEGLGFKFKGASGPAILWMICLLVITWSIKILW